MWMLTVDGETFLFEERPELGREEGRLTVRAGDRYLEFDAPRFVDRREADAIDIERAIRAGGGSMRVTLDSGQLLRYDPPR
jgi:hypothetical protein